MRIGEFVEKYCKDLLELRREADSLITLSEFPHDCEITDSSGRNVPAINVGGTAIPLVEIFTNTKDDFCYQFKDVSGAEEAYDNYMRAVTLLEGPDVILITRRNLELQQKKLAEEIDFLGKV